MSVSILLITHGTIGQAILAAATKTLGELPLQTHTIAIDEHGHDCAALIDELQTCAQAMDDGDGVLILADIYGATPCNIARKLQENDHIQLVAGLNLPMLLRVMNYCNKNLN